MNCSECVYDDFRNESFLSPSSKNSLSFRSLRGREIKQRKAKEISVLNHSKISLKRNEENKNRSMRIETSFPENHVTGSIDLEKNVNFTYLNTQPENKSIGKVLLNKHQERSMTSYCLFSTSSFKNKLNCNKKPINVKIEYSNAYPPERAFKNPEASIEHKKTINFHYLPNRFSSKILDNRTKNYENENFSEGTKDFKIHHQNRNEFPDEELPQTRDVDFGNIEESNSHTKRELKIKRLHSATETTFQENNQNSSMIKSLKTLGLGHLEEIVCKKTESIADPNEPIEEFSEVIYGMRKIEYPGPKMISSETKILEKEHKNKSSKKEIISSDARKESYSEK